MIVWFKQDNLVLNTTIEKVINADKEYNTSANKKLNNITNKTINADKKRNAIVNQ